MPPVFGIVQTNLQQPDQIKIAGMMALAKYIIPRNLVINSIPGFWTVAALAGNGRDTGRVAFRQSGKLAIVADASLYNHKELIHRLGNNMIPETAGDEELILFAYEKWGEHCLEFLYGDYAFLIFNSQTGDIFCGRDPIGVRPFFYTMQENSFIFASELRMLPGAFDKKPDVSDEYLYDTLTGVKSPRG